MFPGYHPCQVLRAEDIVREPMMLHEQISVLKIKVQRLGLDVTRELQAVVSRLPTHYRSAGVRVYNPLKPQWKLQLAWALQLGLCAFLVRYLDITPMMRAAALPSTGYP